MAARDDASAADDLRLLDIDIATMFALTPSGRILRESPRDNSPGPRLFFACCAGGDRMRLRFDVSDPVARAIQALAETEPPWRDPARPPAGLSALMDLLAQDAPVQAAASSLIYRLPHGLAFETDAEMVCSDTSAGEDLLAGLAKTGMPPHLVEAGFVGLDDFWAPWCAARIAGEIAAMVFAARLGPEGAETGVYTFPAYRGRGLGAAVTAAWSRLPALADRSLFYSTHLTNRSSQRVAERLGLRRFAHGIALRDL